MQRFTQQLTDQRLWMAAEGLDGYDIPDDLYQWLLEPRSTTKKFTQQCTRMTIELLGEHWRYPTEEEFSFLKIDKRTLVLIREINMVCDGKAWLFARSVIPLSTMTGQHRVLANLQDQPLGKHLFADPSMRRSPFDFKPVSDSTDLTSSQLWARRSSFHLGGKPLMLYELFLSDFPAYHSETVEGETTESVNTQQDSTHPASTR